MTSVKRSDPSNCAGCDVKIGGLATSSISETFDCRDVDERSFVKLEGDLLEPDKLFNSDAKLFEMETEGAYELMALKLGLASPEILVLDLSPL